MVAGLQAYLSVLGMELVIAVNAVVQRAQNGERGFAPEDAMVLMQRNRPNGQRRDQDSPERKRPRTAKEIRRRRRLARRRRSAVAYFYEVAQSSVTTRGAPRWGQQVAASCQRLFLGETPDEGHVGMPRRLREHLQQQFFARGPMGTVAMVSGILRMLGAIMMDIGVQLETYLVQQQLFDEAVGMQDLHAQKEGHCTSFQWKRCHLQGRTLLRMTVMTVKHKTRNRKADTQMKAP